MEIITLSHNEANDIEQHLPVLRNRIRRNRAGAYLYLES